MHDAEAAFAAQHEHEFGELVVADAGLELAVQGVRGDLPERILVDLIKRDVDVLRLRFK